MASARRRPRRCATGLFATHDELVISTVAAGLTGPRLLDQRREPLHADGLSATLRALDEADALPGRLVCGVDPRHLFSITRKVGKPVAARDRPGVARRLLPPRLGALRGGVVSDAAPLKLGGGARALVVACARGHAEAFDAGLLARPASRLRLAAAPLVLAELALRGARGRHGVLRAVYIPGDPHGLALLRAGTTTVAWRLIDAADGASHQSILTALMSLVDHAREDLELGEPSRLVACLGKEGREEGEQLAAELGLALELAPACFADPESFSRALAEAGLRPESPAFDLFGELHPRTDLRSHFPRAAATGVGVALVAGAAWLLLQTDTVQTETERLRRQSEALAAQLDVLPAELPDTLEDLELATGSARAFLDDRVYWERPLRSLPALIPGEMRLVGLEARDPMIDPLDGPGFSSDRRQLVITGEAALAAAQHAPPAALALTDALRDDPVLSEALGRVSGANIQLASTPKGSVARIQVACLDRRSAP